MDSLSNDNKIKHLEFIQLVITRMSVNSFLLKGWTITLVSAVFAFAAKDTNPKYFWISFIAILVFWGLDAYYLLQERLYRSLYEIRAKPANAIDFSMNTQKFNVIKGNNWVNCIGSNTLLFFYFALVSITTFIILYLK